MKLKQLDKIFSTKSLSLYKFLPNPSYKTNELNLAYSSTKNKPFGFNNIAKYHLMENNKLKLTYFPKIRQFEQSANLLTTKIHYFPKICQFNKPIDNNLVAKQSYNNFYNNNSNNGNNGNNGWNNNDLLIILAAILVSMYITNCISHHDNFLMFFVVFGIIVLLLL